MRVKVRQRGPQNARLAQESRALAFAIIVSVAHTTG